MGKRLCWAIDNREFSKLLETILCGRFRLQTLGQNRGSQDLCDPLRLDSPIAKTVLARRAVDAACVTTFVGKNAPKQFAARRFAVLCPNNVLSKTARD